MVLKAAHIIQRVLLLRFIMPELAQFSILILALSAQQPQLVLWAIHYIIIRIWWLIFSRCCKSGCAAGQLIKQALGSTPGLSCNAFELPKWYCKQWDSGLYLSACGPAGSATWRSPRTSPLLLCTLHLVRWTHFSPLKSSQKKTPLQLKERLFAWALLSLLNS